MEFCLKCNFVYNKKSMSDTIFQNLSLLASLVFVYAYIPQILHLIRVKDSTGIDIPAWVTWFCSALVLTVYAVHQKDIVFVTLTALESLALCTVIVLSIRYKRK